MRKIVLLLAMISFSIVATSAAEPLLLEPLSPAELSTLPASVQSTTVTTPDGEVQVSVPTQSGTSATYDSNMVPQNAAAEGKPVPQKRQPRVRIQTKQRSQGNSYWNAGGKGTKSFF
ncbi:MAG: hypothetical protein E7Z87_06475 [Cyanobacteria bacterium SIG26]|nr:hypothetical protein [Cyanobacteria bacterium SIG26]